MTNTGSTTAVVRLKAVKQPDPIDFGGGTQSPCVMSFTGDNVLAGGESCTLLVRFFADPFFRRSTATVLATAVDPGTGETLDSRELSAPGRKFTRHHAASWS